MAVSISWSEAEPRRLGREREAMSDLGTEMVWSDEVLHRGRRHYGWLGVVPLWAAERSQPPGLKELLGERRLTLAIAYPEGFPMIPPVLIPRDPSGNPLVPIAYRTMHEWHVMGDGSLCLLQSAIAWRPTFTAAELLAEAPGWFAEYLLMEEGRIKQMTEKGIGVDRSLDELIATYATDG